jgi:hypothetical protein
MAKGKSRVNPLIGHEKKQNSQKPFESFAGFCGQSFVGEMSDFKRFADELRRPVELRFGNGERGRESQHGLVRLLGE